LEPVEPPAADRSATGPERHNSLSRQIDEIEQSLWRDDATFVHRFRRLERVDTVYVPKRRGGRHQPAQTAGAS
jgi:hypothetical protein